MAEQLERPPAASDLHEVDFYTWRLTHAEAARSGRTAELDLGHIAEELEALGDEQSLGLRSAYRVLLVRLLEWRYQPSRRSRSWAGSIVRERGDASDRLENNRGLLQHRHRLFAEAYARARREAAAETGLPLATFSLDCPFPLDQALDDEFWPEAA
jgi:hypothetical protein